MVKVRIIGLRLYVYVVTYSNNNASHKESLRIYCYQTAFISACFWNIEI